MDNGIDPCNFPAQITQFQRVVYMTDNPVTPQFEIPVLQLFPFRVKFGIRQIVK